MNKKLLSVALLGGLAVAQTALAQDYDDRWYVAGSTGVNFQDSDRNTEDALFGTLGFGKFLNPNWSLDAAQKLDADRPFALIPRTYAHYLERRARSGLVTPSTPKEQRESIAARYRVVYESARAARGT